LSAGRRRTAYVGLGSNLADPQARIAEAIERLAAIPGSEVQMRSSLYRSAPYGPVEQPDFVNAVLVMTTERSARELLSELQAIETAMGRRRGERWGPRVIDLDLLVYGDEVIREDGLVVPHPGIAERNFVLLPLREIAPELVIPGLGTVAGLPVSASEPRIEQIEERNEQP
jgi:2-amino-4-hydroxy-6-hydroxymethyldihydropteridine diphosphokinase